MKKKKLFSFPKRKRRVKKKKLEDELLSKDNKLPKLILKLKSNNKKFKDYLKDNYSDQIKAIKKFLLIISGYGLVINYSLHFIFGLNFNLFTLFSWGIAYYFISDEFVEWFRRLIAKR